MKKLLALALSILAIAAIALLQIKQPSQLSQPAHVLGYIVQVSRDEDFSEVLFEVSGLQKPEYEPTVVIAQNFGAGDYYWRVAERNKAGQSSFTKPRYFPVWHVIATNQSK